MTFTVQCLEALTTDLKANPIQHDIYARGLQIVNLVYQSRGKLSAVISGESGTGKTTLCEAFERQHPREEGDEGFEVPVVYISMPTRPTVKAFATAILEKLGVGILGRPDAEMLLRQVKTLLVACKSRVVVIDEVQHFIDRRGQDAVAEMADCLKVIMDQTGVSAILVGLPRIILMLRSNEQLRRRINLHHSLQSFEIGTKIGQQEFLHYLRYVEKHIPFSTPQRISTADLLLPLWYASNGLIDYVNKLIGFAGDIALSAGEEKLNKAHFEMAFREFIWPGAQNEDNPFHADFRQRPLTANGEPFAPVLPKRARGEKA